MDELTKLMDEVMSVIKFTLSNRKDIVIGRVHGKWCVLFDQDGNWLYRGDSFDEAIQAAKDKIALENNDSHKE